jgi:hypothetical protein
MCGVVRKSGDVTMLFPSGVTNFNDVAWFLLDAISHGLSILSWYENYSEDELPAEHLWDDPEGLEKWFKKVSDKRGWTRKVQESGDTLPEEGEMEENEWARAFKDAIGD